MTEQNLIVPNNSDEAVVSDILIQEHKKIIVPKTASKPDYTFAKSSEEYISEYERTKNRDVIYRDFPEYVASDMLSEVDMSEKSYKTVYTIRVRLIKLSKAVVGEKCTSRYGGKGEHVRPCSYILLEGYKTITDQHPDNPGSTTKYRTVQDKD
jgi:hypothetical protein